MDRSATPQAMSQETEYFWRQQDSTWTVQSRLHQHILSAQRPWLWLLLMSHHRQKRLLWCTTYLDARMGYCHTFRRISILLIVLSWSHPCSAASWKTHFVSAKSTSSYWSIRRGNSIVCPWILVTVTSCPDRQHFEHWLLYLCRIKACSSTVFLRTANKLFISGDNVWTGACCRYC